MLYGEPFLQFSMITDWIAMEHYRLHVVENWPDSPLREVTLAAIHSKLASFGQEPHLTTGARGCSICSSRLRTPGVHAVELKLRVVAEHPKARTAARA